VNGSDALTPLGPLMVIGLPAGGGAHPDGAVSCAAAVVAKSVAATSAARAVRIRNTEQSPLLRIARVDAAIMSLIISGTPLVG
jgi:hypothetical protein